VEVARGIYTAKCPMGPIEGMQYNSSVMNFKKFKKL